MRKVNAKKVLKRSQAKSRRKWAIVSFSLDSEALEAFKQACKRKSVKASVVIEEFMKEFASL